MRLPWYSHWMAYGNDFKGKHMKLLRYLIMAGVLAGAAILLTSVAAVQGAPLEQSNVLANADFEAGTVLWDGDPARQVPEGWTGWADQAKARPRYNPAQLDIRVQSGAQAASYWELFQDYDAGLYQTYDQATPGTIYRFQAYGQAWSTENPEVSTSTTDVHMQIGIDPNGGTNPYDAAVVWSGVISALDQYYLFQVDATANNSVITVFLRGATTYPVDQTDIYWDNTSLVAVGQTEPPADQPTNTPAPSSSSDVPAGSIPKSTPAPDGSVVHVVKAGETLIGIAVTYDVTLEDLRRLNNLTTDMVFVGQTLVIKLAEEPTLEPTEEPAAEEPAAGEEPAEEPAAEEPAPSEVADAEGNGTICVMGYDDVNGNGIREPQETSLAGLTFVLSDGSNTVGTYTTDGVSEPYCFTELTPGAYIISWVADSFTATTDQTWAASVSGGSTVSHEFGAQGGDAAGADETDAQQEAREGLLGLPTWLLALVGALGMILFLSGVGAAAYFLIIRRNTAIE